MGFISIKNSFLKDVWDFITQNVSLHNNLDAPNQTRRRLMADCRRIHSIIFHVIHLARTPWLKSAGKGVFGLQELWVISMLDKIILMHCNSSFQISLEHSLIQTQSLSLQQTKLLYLIGRQLFLNKVCNKIMCLKQICWYNFKYSHHMHHKQLCSI